MKVLVASKFLHHVGGVETYIAWLAEHLPHGGADVAFFGMEPPTSEPLMAELEGPVYLSPSRDFHGSPATRLRSASAAVYSTAAAAAMRQALDGFDPDVVHFQSTSYQLTPSVVAAVARRAIPMVTTAHDYKFVCSNYRLWDDGRQRPCVKCLDASTPKRVGHVLATRCVKGSLGASMIAAAELPVSNGVWRRAPGVVHAPSRFMASLLEGSGSPVRGRVRYLDLAWGDADQASDVPGVEGDVTYLGRLSLEKGVETLVAAWPQVALRRPEARLKLFGSGADEARLRALATAIPGIEFCGRYERSELPSILAASAMTVHPSSWSENSPYTVRESLRHGVPAIVSDQGGLPEMVEPRTGTVVPATDVRALAQAILDELEQPRARHPGLLEAVEARHVSDDDHLRGLQGLYDEAISMARSAR